MGTLLRQMREKLCPKNEITPLNLNDSFVLHFDQFENSFNQCGRNITFSITKLV